MTNNTATKETKVPQSEAERVLSRKKIVVERLTNTFNQETWRARLLLICGGDESRVMKSLNSYLTYIMNDDGGSNKDKKSYICDCTLPSISTAFIEAFQMGIEVGGGRDHAYLVNYACQCELEISYKGFVYALGKNFDNAFVSVGCVFQEDDFKCELTDTSATFTHVPKDPFQQSWDKLRGVYCFFSYTLRDNGMEVSRLAMVHKTGPDSLEMIRSKAKASFAWKDFPLEMAKKAVVRRAAKIPFASIDFGDMEINPEEVDNRRYTLEGNADGKERLKLLMDRQREILGDEKEKPKEETKPEDEQCQTYQNASAGPATMGKMESSQNVVTVADGQSSHQQESQIGKMENLTTSDPADANSPPKETSSQSSPAKNTKSFTKQTGKITAAETQTSIPTEEKEGIPIFLTNQTKIQQTQERNGQHLALAREIGAKKKADEKPTITDADFEETGKD